MKIPRLIALCGRPDAGKTTVQNILERKYGVQPIDDGMVLRWFCVQELGMSWDDVQTADGKNGFVEILGKRWQRRKILGELGNALERTFGAHILPWIATRELGPNESYSFGSVQRDQGAFFKSLGGVVIEVQNHCVMPSVHEFDQYDAALVDVRIDNNWREWGMTPEGKLIHLERMVAGALAHLACKNRPIDFVEVAA